VFALEQGALLPNLVRFGTFEVDLTAGELRKNGVKLKLTGQPFQVLAILLERPGQVVTREELQKKLWPDTFVDVDRGLNATINRIREVLSDSAESPRFVETLPRRGYRFIAPVGGGEETKTVGSAQVISSKKGDAETRRELRLRSRIVRYSVVAVTMLLLVAASYFIYRKLQSPTNSQQRALTRLTFDEGLQTGATWSPDGRFIAYSFNRGGKSDIWVRQVTGGDPVRITTRPGNNWQPDWSPDGKYIAYRSEEGNGGVYIVPALGGSGLERKIASFGYRPRWSPDSSQILFRASLTWFVSDETYLVKVDGGEPHALSADFGFKRNLPAMSASWHPDGKRISIWTWEPSGPSFWTVPATGGLAVQSEIAPEVARHLSEASVDSGVEPTLDLESSWAPSGRAIYFERAFRGARNLWKMTIDPKTQAATAIERVTTGPGLDTELAVSADGKKLAYTVENRHVRAWLFPFDASRGRLTGAGRPVTPPGIESWRENMSRDGKRLAFCSVRAGKWEVWEKSLPDGEEVPILADNYKRNMPKWSPDGERMTYLRYEKAAIGQGESRLMVWSRQTHKEEPITAPSTLTQIVHEWSADGKQLLASLENSDTHRAEIWLMPIANAGPQSGPSARKIAFHPTYSLWDSHFSPDGRWIILVATANTEANIYVIPASGGPWSLISKGQPWADKPRWSPDGKTIYFISARTGVFNVWGIGFDSTSGKPVGDEFRVTAFESPGLMIPDAIPLVELSVTEDKLVQTMEERSGSIWVLDNVEQ